MTAAVYVLDTGPLSHFAAAGWLGILKTLLAEGRVVIPETVHRELLEGLPGRAHLGMVLEAGWIDTVRLESVKELACFAEYQRLLVGPDGRNLGECGVLALAESLSGSVAVVDERVAYNLGRGRGVEVRRTLGLLVEAIRKELLTVPLVSAVADDLISSNYRLPFEAGDFARWAEENGLGGPV